MFATQFLRPTMQHGSHSRLRASTQDHFLENAAAYFFDGLNFGFVGARWALATSGDRSQVGQLLKKARVALDFARQ